MSLHPLHVLLLLGITLLGACQPCAPEHDTFVVQYTQQQLDSRFGDAGAERPVDPDDLTCEALCAPDESEALEGCTRLEPTAEDDWVVGASCEVIDYRPNPDSG